MLKFRDMPPRTKSTTEPITVDPIWLLKAGAITVLAAIFCAWLTLCGLFYQGQWQLVLHPSAIVDKTPATLGLPFDPISFAVNDSGTPQLTGWYLPAGPGARFSKTTILFLHDGAGSLADTLPQLQQLHALGLNIFAFDYRGYGLSVHSHLSNAHLSADAESAYQYLAETKKLNPKQIIPFGDGIGASLALEIAQNHPRTPAIIAENPVPDLLQKAKTDPRSHLVPVGLLYNNPFDLSALSTLPTPKLLIAPPNSPRITNLYKQAASPKTILTTDGPLTEAIKRFIDEYQPTYDPQPLPLPAPHPKKHR